MYDHDQYHQCCIGKYLHVVGALENDGAMTGLRLGLTACFQLNSAKIEHNDVQCNDVRCGKLNCFLCCCFLQYFCI